MAVSGLLGDIPRKEQEEALSGFVERLQRIRPSTDNIDPSGIVLPPDIGTAQQMEGDASPQWDDNMARVMQLMRRIGAI
jgi:hypothetical protein